MKRKSIQKNNVSKDDEMDEKKENHQGCLGKIQEQNHPMQRQQEEKQDENCLKCHSSVKEDLELEKRRNEQQSKKKQKDDSWALDCHAVKDEKENRLALIR